ncbi:MAG: hypothetical protein ACRETT_07735 [Steroidobacteraceae bacterium]
MALALLLAPALSDAARARRSLERPPGIPADVALEASDARIGRIEFRIGDVFDASDPRESGGLYALANELHIDTRASAIQAQLLFREGDPYSRRVLDESERVLRNLRYLFDADIRPIRYYDNTVDVEVATRDVWTLNPGLSFKRRGGENASRYELEDTNVLGRGKRISVARTSNVDRNSWILQWDDPNVWSSRWRVGLDYAENSDGRQRAVLIEHPFFALDSRRALGAHVADFDRIESRYVLGEIADQFRHEERSAEVFGGLSSGFRNGWVRRVLAGYRFEESTFGLPDTGTAPASLPPDRTVSFPWIGVEWVQDDFKETSNLNQIGRTEDLAFGLSARLEAGWSAESLGATRDAAIVRGTLSDGFHLTANQYVFVAGELASRVEHADPANLIASGRASYYLRTGGHGVLFASAELIGTDALDPENQVLLGGSNGLRGYPLRYQTGSGLALVTLEQRLYTDWYPFRLVRVGGAVFFDAGRTWGRGALDAPNLGWLADVGVGLRLGMSRSGLGNVLHVDVALPLNGDDSIDSVQLQVETKRSF